MAKNPGGRPPKYTDPVEMQKGVDEYFDGGGETVELFFKGQPYPVRRFTLSGLAYHLGYVNRQSLYDNEKNDKFSDIIKAARLRIERQYEALATTMGGAGPIFILKNMGWKDESTVKTLDVHKESEDLEKVYDNIKQDKVS